MKIKALKKLLHTIIDEGYGDWKVYLCDDDDDDYTVNHIYLDDDGDICLQSTDTESETYDFTANNILNRLKKYDEERDIRLHARLIANAKAEAVKEFAERLKEMKYESIEWSHGKHPYVVEESDIDNLVEEMAGDK